MKNKFIAGIIIGVLATVTFGFVEYQNIYFKINKNMDIFGRVYKEIVSNYVDEVDPEKFMRSGIDGMLETLDPYTVFIGEKEGDDLDLITHGQYGGIGVSIGVRDGSIIVVAPMEGYSAQKQGVRAGDRLIEIDGEKISSSNPDSVRSKVRGEPGTTVRIKIEREGEAQPLEFVLVREEIQINNVTYSGYVKEGIGYIKLERFSRRAGDEVRQAIKELKASGELKGIILDLRDNPGGLLEAAVEIVSKFVPNGSTVVTTRGRKDDEKIYSANEEPLVSDIPLAVLINKNSASASEIVAGAVQDLDRGILIGTRSFGKGLVQTILPLSYNTSMKITTARYYTPSGRSIQEIDYLHKNKDGVFLTTPDSLKHEYKTSRGRIVKDFGGVMPDSIVLEHERSTFYQELMRKAMFFKFATRYVTKHPPLQEKKNVAVDEPLIKEFEEYVQTQKFEYRDDVEKKLAEVKESLTKEHYSSAALESIDALNVQLNKEKINGITRHENEIREELEEELNARYSGEKGRIKTSLQFDTQVQTATGLLLNKKEYEKKLKLKK